MKITVDNSSVVNPNYLKDQIEGHQFVANELLKEIKQTKANSPEYAKLVKQLSECQADIAEYTKQLDSFLTGPKMPVLIETKKAIYFYDGDKGTFFKVQKPGGNVFIGSGRIFRARILTPNILIPWYNFAAWQKR